MRTLTLCLPTQRCIRHAIEFMGGLLKNDKFVVEEYGLQLGMSALSSHLRFKQFDFGRSIEAVKAIDPSVMHSKSLTSIHDAQNSYEKSKMSCYKWRQELDPRQYMINYAPKERRSPHDYSRVMARFLWPWLYRSPHFLEEVCCYGAPRGFWGELWRGGGI